MGEMSTDPLEIAALERSLNESASRVSTIWVSFVLFSLYLIISAVTVTNHQLFVADTIKLPVLNIDLPLFGFFLIAPIIFVIFHLYLYLQIILLGRTAAVYGEAVDARFRLKSENARLRQRLPNTLFAQLFAGSPKERLGLFGWCLRSVAWVTLVFGPAATVLAFLISFLPAHSVAITSVHRIVLAIELFMFVAMWPRMILLFRGSASKEVEHGVLFSTWHGPRWLDRLSATAIALAAVTFSVTKATFPGDPIGNLARGSSWETIDCQSGHKWFRDRIDLSRNSLVDTNVANQLQSEMGTSSVGHRRYVVRSQRWRNFDCGTFVQADLRFLDLSETSFVNADFRGALVTGATFDKARLRGASFQSAIIDGAQFDGADLSGAIFKYASLTGAAFRGANLKVASFEMASLQGADLSLADLTGSIFLRASLEGASLIHSTIRASLFNGVKLQGAVLESAEMSLLYLEDAWLQGSNYVGAKMDNLSLKGSYLWKASPANCGISQRGEGPETSELIFDKVIAIREFERPIDGVFRTPIPAAPDEILKYVDETVAKIRGRQARDNAKRRLIRSFFGTWEHEEMRESSWKSCEREFWISSRKTDLLRAVVGELIAVGCESPSAAAGVIENWLINGDFLESHWYARSYVAHQVIKQIVGGCGSFKLFAVMYEDLKKFADRTE